MASNKNIRFIIDNKFEVFPVNTSKLRITHSRQQDQLFFRKKLSDSLVFIKNNCGGFGVGGDHKAEFPLVDGFDYILRGVKDFGCKVFYIEVQQRCGRTGQAWLTKFKGMFSKYDCDYDLDANTILAKTEPNDGYSCMLAKWDRKYNVLDNTDVSVPTLQETKLLKTTRWVRYYCLFSYIESYKSDAQGRATQPDTRYGYCNRNPMPSVSGYDVITWIMEEGTFKFADNAIKDDERSSGTIDIYNRPYNSSTCFRGVIGVSSHFPATSEPQKWERLALTGGIGWYVKSAGFEFISVNIRGCINISNLLNNLVSRLGCNIVQSSTGIFNYNTNPVTNTTPNILRRLYITQKSNVVRFYVSAPATIMQLTLKQTLGFIRHLYQIYPILESVGNNGQPVLRLEHISWFKTQGGTWDLGATNPETLKGYNKYSYDKKDMPFKETWEVADIKDLSVTYGSNCANTETEAKFSESNIWLDINSMLSNEDSGYDGVVFLYGGLNAYESGASIDYWQTIKDYYKEERPFKNGVRLDIGAGQEVIWNSTTMNKSQEDIIIPFPCQTLDKQIIKTTLGVGALESAEEDLSAGTIKLKIKFQR